MYQSSSSSPRVATRSCNSDSRCESRKEPPRSSFRPICSLRSWLGSDSGREILWHYPASYHKDPASDSSQIRSSSTHLCYHAFARQIVSFQQVLTCGAPHIPSQRGSIDRVVPRNAHGIELQCLCVAAVGAKCRAPLKDFYSSSLTRSSCQTAKAAAHSY